MRKALIVGIDHYAHVPALHGCVNDALSVNQVLERHGDGQKNFDVNLITSDGAHNFVLRNDLRGRIQALFRDDSDIALFYFSGHGHIEATAGYLLASDSKTGDDGISLNDVMTYANESRARNRIVILDSCFAGIAGANPTAPAQAEVRQGVTILAAATEDQYAIEENGSGVFTGLFVDALNGAAANLVGKVTPGSVYAHIDQSLGAWAQRPVFKTNVKSFVSLRNVRPVIGLDELQRITEFFPSPGYEFPLDPTYEPELSGRFEGAPDPNPDNTAKFAILQKYNRVNLVVPVDAPHMWHAAMEGKACRLTALGEHYRRLAAGKRL